LLPVNVIRPLIPVLDGQKRERDAAEDARWDKAIRTQLLDADVRLNATVGAARLRLGELIAIQPGNVINITNPRNATVLAGDVPVIAGTFGIHAGQNAIETKVWIDPNSTVH